MRGVLGKRERTSVRRFWEEFSSWDLKTVGEEDKLMGRGKWLQRYGSPASSTSQSGVWNSWKLLISKHECAVCERQDCKGDLSYVTKDPGSEGHSAGQPTPVAPLWMCCRPTVGPTVDPSLFSVGCVQWGVSGPHSTGLRCALGDV